MNTCHACKGLGEVERQRSRWIGGGKDGYRRTWFVMVKCEECGGTGKGEGPDGPTSDSPISYGGHVIDAPGFTQEQFERAMCRALVDELEVHTDETGIAIVTHRGVNGGYRVTRTSCDCPAGVHGMPCKHRAALLFHLQVDADYCRVDACVVWSPLQRGRCEVVTQDGCSCREFRAWASCPHYAAFTEAMGGRT